MSAQPNRVAESANPITMPYTYKGIEVVTMHELVPEHYTYGALSQALHRHKDLPYGPKRALQGGNGRELLVVLSSLPSRIRGRFWGSFPEWMPVKYR